ncbi:MAG: hypothetical protein Q8K82_00120 [Gemmatimonadaceae bacterium]|nr:hypothetical protein [Gemmatimonadaceae bacterium]
MAVLAAVGVHGLVRLRAWRPAASAAETVVDPDATIATRTLPAAVMAVLFAGALFSPLLEIYRRVKAEVGLTNAQEYDTMQYGPYGRWPGSFVAIARYLRSRTTERDEVLVWGTVQRINFLSGRRSPTRFDYLRALTDARDSRFRPKYLREFFDNLRTKPPTYVVAVDEQWCGVVVRSGLTSIDHSAFPMRCLSELPEFQRFVGERYAVERSFGNYNVLRLR